MKKSILTWVILIIAITGNAQFSESFDDGDLSNNPSWQYAPADFVVNAAKQLQSANSTTSSSFTITTPHQTVLQTEWAFWSRFDFNPSSANYTDVWLAAALEDINSTANAGYFVRIGSTDDDICLYKKLPGSMPQKIIDGVDDLLNNATNTVSIKVICTIGKKWILLRDVTGTGEQWKSEGYWTDDVLQASHYFGISIKQSTPSFFGKHFFDDFNVKQFEEVTGSPKIIAATATGSNTVKLTFDRTMDAATVENPQHYFISGIGQPLTATAAINDGSTVVLVFDKNFTPNEKNTLLVDNVGDAFGNALSNGLIDFYFYRPQRYDVVISEVFADPSPSVGLPSQKFIELKNNALFPVALKNWRLSDGNNTASLPDIEIVPGGYIILTTSTGIEAYRNFGPTFSVTNFPSLSLAGGAIALYDEAGSLMHAMKYDLTTYQNELKKAGGYTLEMINTKVGCAIDSNWTASNDASGGTPGRKNSVDAEKQFLQDFEITNGYLTSTDTLYLEINKPVDSAAAAKIESYSVDGGLQIASVDILSPFFSTVRIKFMSPASPNKIYTIKINQLSACDDSKVSAIKNTISFAVPEPATPGDLVINEILFDPLPEGVDYVELYNKSDKAIDLKTIYIANRNASGVPASFVPVATNSRLLLPNGYALLTTDPSATLSQYPLAGSGAFVKTGSLPSFPDDGGTCILMDQQGTILDEINYSKYWHFSLIKDREGISLERIAFVGPSDQTNFHSASSALKGTPGYKNSQSSNEGPSAGSFSLSSEIFSPDNDGTDDFLTINYQFTEAGNVTNIKIFDASGRMVRCLEKNSLSGIKGYYRWDGLDDKSRKLPAGIYIVYFESFAESGKKSIHKKSVVLARRW